MFVQREKEAYETDLEIQSIRQTITTDQVCLRELPVYSIVDGRRAPAQPGVLQRDLRFAGVYDGSVRLRARRLCRVMVGQAVPLLVPVFRGRP